MMHIIVSQSAHNVSTIKCPLKKLKPVALRPHVLAIWIPMPASGTAKYMYRNAVHVVAVWDETSEAGDIHCTS